MLSGTEIQTSYLNAVLSEIRWKRAHSEIRRELECHLADQTQANRDSGMSESEAAQAAVLDMGDAVLVGGQLDKAYRPKPQWSILAFLVAFIVAAFVLRQAFPPETGSIGGFFASLVLGGLAFAALYLYGGVWIARYAWWICGGLILWRCSSVWSNVAFNDWMIPSAHYCALLAPVVLSLLLLRMRGHGFLALTVIWSLVWIPLVSGYLIYQIDAVSCGYWVIFLSCAAVLAAGCFLGWFGTHKARNFLLLLVPCLALSAYIVVESPYRLERLTALLGLGTDAVGYGFMHSLIRAALGNCRWFGAMTPLTEGILPAGFTFGNGDYLLTQIMMRFGFIAGLAVILIVFAFCALLIRKCLRLPGTAARMLALSASAVIVCETVGYALSNLGVPLVQFMPLPFLSEGSTARVFNFALLGFLCGMFRTENLRDTPESIQSEHPSRIRFSDGRLTVDFRRKRADA